MSDGAAVNPFVTVNADVPEIAVTTLPDPVVDTDDTAPAAP